MRARPLLSIVPLLVALAMLPLPLFAAAQQASQLPVRSATRLVQISVIASNKKGEPVEDLTPGDFAVLDNGQPAKIQVFEKQTDELPANSPPALPPDIYTNQVRRTSSAPANVTMLLLDGLNTEVTDQASARQQTIKFLQQIQRGDRLAIYTLGRELRVLQNFTSDSSKLVEALGKYSGQTTADLEGSTPTDIQIGDANMDALLQEAFQREANIYIQERVQITVNALIDIANYASALPGRKNLLWIAGSFPFSVGYENLQTLVSLINSPQSETNISGEQLMFAEEIEKAARALTDANIAVYPVDARGLLGLNMNTTKGSNKTPGYGAMNTAPESGMGGGGGGHHGGGAAFPGARVPRMPRQNSQNPANPMFDPDNTTFETLNALAEGTGGKAFYNTNDISGSLKRAMGDSRVTYEIGYYPSGVKWDGSFHNVTVKVQKPDVEVRARKGYFAIPEPAPNAEALHDLIAGALVSPLDSTALDLGVRITATARDKQTAVTAMIIFNPRSIQFDFKDGHFDGAANLVLAQLDGNNQVLDAAQRSFPLSFAAGEYEQFLKRPVQLTQEVDILPNAARLRVLVCDGMSGKVGTVTIPLAKYLKP
jgi:VWFA-related protein